MDNNNSSKKSGILKEIRNYIIVIVVSLLIGAFIKQFVFQINHIPSESMYPTLEINDKVYTTIIFNEEKLKYGDIITFKPPEHIVNNEIIPSNEFKENNVKTTYIKRLIGLPGDTIEVKNGQLIVNGEVKDEPFINDTMDYEFDEITVPEGHVFVLGDNRNNSFDSHLWTTTSFVPLEDIVGKAVYKVFPFSKFTKL